MIGDLPAGGRITIGAGKDYNTAAFVARMRELGVTPHWAQNINAHRGSNIDARTTRHAGYRASQVIRKRIEEANRWIKCVAGMEETKHRRLAKVGWIFQFKASAYNLVRFPKTDADRIIPPIACQKAGSIAFRERSKPRKWLNKCQFA